MFYLFILFIICFSNKCFIYVFIYIMPVVIFIYIYVFFFIVIQARNSIHKSECFLFSKWLYWFLTKFSYTAFHRMTDLDHLGWKERKATEDQKEPLWVWTDMFWNISCILSVYQSLMRKIIMFFKATDSHHKLSWFMFTLSQTCDSFSAIYGAYVRILNTGYLTFLLLNSET